MRGRLLPTRPREGADDGALELTHWYQNASVALGVDCAKNAATLTHERPKPVITLEQRRERKRRYMRKRYRQRLSSVAATDAANPPVAEG